MQKSLIVRSFCDVGQKLICSLSWHQNMRTMARLLLVAQLLPQLWVIGLLTMMDVALSIFYFFILCFFVMPLLRALLRHRQWPQHGTIAIKIMIVAQWSCGLHSTKLLWWLREVRIEKQKKQLPCFKSAINHWLYCRVDMFKSLLVDRQASALLFQFILDINTVAWYHWSYFSVLLTLYNLLKWQGSTCSVVYAVQHTSPSERLSKIMNSGHPHIIIEVYDKLEGQTNTKHWASILFSKFCVRSALNCSSMANVLRLQHKVHCFTKQRRLITYVHFFLSFFTLNTEFSLYMSHLSPFKLDVCYYRSNNRYWKNLKYILIPPTHLLVSRSSSPVDCYNRQQISTNSPNSHRYSIISKQH